MSANLITNAVRTNVSETASPSLRADSVDSRWQKLAKRLMETRSKEARKDIVNAIKAPGIEGGLSSNLELERIQARTFKTSKSTKVEKSPFKTEVDATNSRIGGRLYFPTADEVLGLSANNLQEIWDNNNLTLLGMVSQSNIPSIGFHGTGKEGIVGIQQDRCSKGALFVAACQSRAKTPVLFLADLYTITGRALNYSEANVLQKEAGGIFLIDMSHEISKELEGYSPGFFVCPTCDARVANPYRGFKCYPSLPFETEPQKKFLNLIHRTIGNPTAKDFVILVNKENYDQRIIGTITSSQYPRNKMDEVQKQDLYKYFLVRRLRVQEHILQALAILHVPSSCQDSWSKGKALMDDIDRSTGITKELWAQLENGPRQEEPKELDNDALADLDKEPPPLD